jgi:hypothetical protein
MSMLRDFYNAMRNGDNIAWNGKAFCWESVDSYGSIIEHAAVPEVMRRLIADAVDMEGNPDPELQIKEITGYFNRLIDEYENFNGLGKIVDRRERIIDSSTMFTGASKRKVYEILVELSNDWIDNRPIVDPIQYKTGDRVWFETTPQSERV